MRKSIFNPGFNTVGSIRVPGQSPQLLLPRDRLRVRFDQSGMSELTRPPKDIGRPVFPSGEHVCRRPEDVYEGLGFAYEDQRQLRQKLQEWQNEPDILSFRKSVMRDLRSFVPDNYMLRSELSRRAMEFYKATKGGRFDRRPGYEGQVLQKGDNDQESGVGTFDHHSQRAMDHTQAALAHAKAAGSAQVKDEASKHQTKVKAAQRASEEATAKPKKTQPRQTRSAEPKDNSADKGKIEALLAEEIIKRYGVDRAKKMLEEMKSKGKLNKSGHEALELLEKAEQLGLFGPRPAPKAKPKAHGTPRAKMPAGGPGGHKKAVAGEIREWKGGRYQKQADGKWKQIGEAKGKEQKAAADWGLDDVMPQIKKEMGSILDQPFASAETKAGIEWALANLPKYKKRSAVFKKLSDAHNQVRSFAGMLKQRAQIEGDSEFWEGAALVGAGAVKIANKLDAKEIKPKPKKEKPSAKPKQKAKDSSRAVPRLLVPTDRGKRKIIEPDEVKETGARLKEVVEENIEQPKAGPDFIFEGKPDIQPPDKNPAIALAPDLWPKIRPESKLPKNVAYFPNPAPLKDSKGDIKGYIEKLFYHQVEGAERILQAWKEGDGCILQDSAGLGKLLPVDTLIATPNGWRKNGDLKVGDYVLGSDGEQTRIKGVFPQGVKSCYRVTFSDHSSVEAGGEHLWTVAYRAGGRRWQELVLTTDQIRNRDKLDMEWPSGRKTVLDLSKTDLYLPMLSAPAKFEVKQELPISAYVMGQCLANGGMANGTVQLTTNAGDWPEVRHELIACGVRFGSNHNYGSIQHTGILGLIGRFRELGLDVKSGEKFIPEMYQMASVQDRIDLLHGLMDADGSISSERNRLVYHSTSERLAEGVRELVEGLGGIASVREYDRTEEGKPIDFQVRIRLPRGILPFTIKRKADRYNPGRFALPVRTIRSVEYTRDVESVCIAVESPDCLYATEHYILTHNTNIALAAMVAQGGKRNLIVVPTAGKEGLKAQWIGPTAAQLYNVEIKGAEVVTDKKGKDKLKHRYDQLSATEDGTYIVSYDELYQVVKDPETGKPVHPRRVEFRPEIFGGKWDTVMFDEAHNMTNPNSKTSAAGKLLMGMADKVLYMSATPFTNISDMQYLTKLNLFDRFKVDEHGNERSEESAFVAWAKEAGAIVKERRYKQKHGPDIVEPAKYRDVKNPASHIPMSAIAATLHVDGKSIKRSTSLEGVTSKFGVTSKSELLPIHRAAFHQVENILQYAKAAAGVPDMILRALYIGWNRQYWETLKVDKAIELGQKALAEGKQVAFFTSFKASNHEHIRAIPRMVMRNALKLQENEKTAALGGAMETVAHRLNEMCEKLPKGESAVQRLAEAFGGPTKVSEIHGDTKKKPHVEQNEYQAGQKKVCVATMARGGTGISLHDTTGESPRVQINLSLPWSGREFNQVAGRSHRLGSKSDTEMHWLIGDDEHEEHNAAVVARRLKSMGSLTTGDPEITVEATSLANFEFGQGQDTDDAKKLIKGIESAMEGSSEDHVMSIAEMKAEETVERRAKKKETGKAAAEEAAAARDWFREFAEQRKGGSDVIKERYKQAQSKKAHEAFLNARRAAEQLRQARGWKIKWRPGLQAFEIDAAQAWAFAKEIKSKKIGGGQGKTYGTKTTMSYWVPADGMQALAKRLNVHEHKIDMRQVADEHLDPKTRSATEVIIDELALKHLKVEAHPDGETFFVTGQTYKAFQNGAFRGIARGQRIGGEYNYVVPKHNLPELLERMGGKLPEGAEKLKAAGEQKRKVEAAAAEKKRKELKLPALQGSDKQISWANAIREKAVGLIEKEDDKKVADAAMRWLKTVRRASAIIDYRHALGYSGRGLSDIFTEIAKSLTWDQELERLRPRLMLRRSSHPLELVWCAEEVPDEMHVSAPTRKPPGWPANDQMVKGANHKYIKRVPTGKPKPKYRYYYRVPGKKGLVSSEDLAEGSKFKAEHEGAKGHFEVRQHHKDKGVVSVRHDESGRTIHIKEKDLHRMMQKQVAKKTRAELTGEVKSKKEEEKKKATAKKPVKLKIRKEIKSKVKSKKEKKQPKIDKEFPKPEKPKKPAPKLQRASMDSLGRGGYDSIEGFAQTPEELERQVQAMGKKDREFAIIEQANGFVLASKSKAPIGSGKIVGDKTQIFIRGSKGKNIQSLDADYEIVDAGSLIASHDPNTFAERKEYPQGVQERRYHEVEGDRNKIIRIAQELEPAMMINTNPDAINGAPIVTEDHIVLGGNGRTMGMQHAYKNYPESAEKLKKYMAQHAKAFGVTAAQVEAMKQPILVRRVKVGTDIDKLRALGRRMNEPLMQGLDPRSAEVALGKNYVTPEVVESLTHYMDPDESLSEFLRSEKSREFMKTLERSGIIDQYNVSEYVNDDNKLLNEDGRLRVERVLAARLLPDASLLSEMGQKLRQNIAKSAVFIMNAEGNKWDLRKPLMTAVKVDREMRSKGFKPNEGGRRDIMKQIEQKGFEGEISKLQKDPVAQKLLEIIQDKNGPRIMLNGFKQFALEAARQQHDFGANKTLFAMEPVSQDQALKTAFGLGKAKVAPIRKQAPMGQPELLAMALREFQDRLQKGEIAPENVAAYTMHAVNWELDRLMRQAVRAASVEAKDIDGQKVLAALRSFIVEQAYQDKDFARGMGVLPLDTKVLEGLVQAHAKANVADISKALAKAGLELAYMKAVA